LDIGKVVEMGGVDADGVISVVGIDIGVGVGVGIVDDGLVDESNEGKGVTEAMLLMTCCSNSRDTGFETNEIP